jgi:tetratricopeptide (TPR) repeat protein
VDDLAPLPPRKQLTALLRRVNEHFVFDPWQNNPQLNHNAETLARSRALGGCGAYALVEVTLVRALGLPARLVLTADADWLKRYQGDGLSLISGHTFVEVQVEGQWLLLDPTFFELYENYRPDHPFYPRKQVFVARGLDFHDLGLHSMTALQALYAHAAARAPLPWQEPDLALIFTLPVHPPTILTQAGQFFMAAQRYPEAQERLTRALGQEPDFPPALLARGQLYFLRRDYAAALTDLDRAIKAAPTDPSGYRWRAQTHAALGRMEAMCIDLDQACALGVCEDQEWARGKGFCWAGRRVRIK